MKTRCLLYVFIIASIAVMAQNCPSGQEHIKSIEMSWEEEILEYTNKERKKHGLKALEMRGDLVYAARYHAKDMAEENYFEHDSYDRKHGNLVLSCSNFDRIAAFANYDYLAENISAGRISAQEVVKGWMKSKGHRKNILNSNLRYIGVGYYYHKDSEYKHYWVQNFGG